MTNFNDGEAEEQIECPYCCEEFEVSMDLGDYGRNERTECTCPHCKETVEYWYEDSPDFCYGEK